MKLPLKIHYDDFGQDKVVDADHKIVMAFPTGRESKFMHALVRKMNRSWRFRLFGEQPFVYSRTDWLYGKPRKA